MKKSIFIFSLFLIFSLILNTITDIKSKSTSITNIEGFLTDTVDTTLIDLTEQYITLNNDPKYKPSDTFRQGHVTKRELNENIKKTDYGYVVDFGTYTNIPTPAVKNGVVFVSGGFGSKEYYAFDAESGQNIWAINLDDDGPSSPAINDSIIVFNTESCTIFACNIKTGEHIWSYWLGDPLMSMPTIANDIVFSAYPAGMTTNIDIQQNQNINIQNNPPINNIDNIEKKVQALYTSHVFIAFDFHTGKILWQSRIDGDVMSAPVAKDEYIYVTTFKGTLFKFKQKTGEIISVKAMRATSAPVFAGEDIIITGRADNKGEPVSEEIVRLSSNGISKSKPIYKRDAPYLDRMVQDKSEFKNKSISDDAGNGFVGGAPSSSGWNEASMHIGQSNVSSLQSFQGSRNLYLDGKNYNTMGNELICMDMKSGKEIWKYKIQGDMNSAGGFMGTPPIYAGKYIIIATYSGEIIISDKDTGKEIKKYNISEPVRYQPVADKGKIFVTSSTGKLHIINTGISEITGWTHWGADCGRTNCVE
jgi:outer membrane protein assembly factor BamB